MKLFFRYRKPSVKTMLGATKAKKRLNKAIGITAVKAPLRAPWEHEAPSPSQSGIV